jgi:hypothetical protein
MHGFGSCPTPPTSDKPPPTSSLKANDVDPHWAGIGADVSALDELLADQRLDVVPADPRQDQPYYR